MASGKWIPRHGYQVVESTAPPLVNNNSPVKGLHAFCANLTHFEEGSHSSEAADLDRSAKVGAFNGNNILGSCVNLSFMDTLSVSLFPSLCTNTTCKSQANHT